MYFQCKNCSILVDDGCPSLCLCLDCLDLKNDKEIEENEKNFDCVSDCSPDFTKFITDRFCRHV